MTFKDLPEERQKELANILKRKERGGATISFSAYFRSKSGKKLIDREKKRTSVSSGL